MALSLTAAALRGQQGTLNKGSDSPHRGGAPTTLYYHGLEYGSQRIFNPLTVILNTGLDVFQFPNHNNHFFSYPYHRAAHNVIVAAAHPFQMVRERGTEKWITSEILPLRLGTHDAAWVPNYALHLIGLGQTYAQLDEFYRVHHVPLAGPLGAVTALGAAFLNEMAETNGGVFPQSSEMVADLYVFDLGSIALFSSTTVRRFFAEKVMLADWSSMPVFMGDGTLRNTGQYFAAKLPVPGLKRTRFFARVGLSGILGLSRDVGGGASWSAGLGASGVRHVIEAGTGIETIDLDWTAGVFYDRYNTVLMSLVWTRHARNLLSMELYPGMLPGPARDLGLWLAVDEGGRPRLGVISGALGGIGFGGAG